MEERAPVGIAAISVKGFKSFAEEQRVEIHPLTLLAGANSSGKSSLLQPLLLLKQTLEATYDPGPLLLDGPNVRFTTADQILTRSSRLRRLAFEVGIERTDGARFALTFRRGDHGFDLIQMVAGEITLSPGMSDIEAEDVAGTSHFDLEDRSFAVIRDRCFLSVVESGYIDGEHVEMHLSPEWPWNYENGSVLRSVIHIPGLRGNPERTYRTTAVGDTFPGTFDNYVASVLLAWQQKKEKPLRESHADLESMGLTWKAEARQLNAAQIELVVGRLPRKSAAADDLVNIADVGFGVSQVLPVVVALHAAKPGQLVYIEQPELHLHPRAQQAMAAVLADAARRGVRVVAETHSAILLLAVQSLVAEGKLDPTLVKLHWFRRDERGATQVHSTDLDENGAYGDWPEDFGEVRAEVENRYLDAVEARAFSRPAAKRAKTKKR